MNLCPVCNLEFVAHTLNDKGTVSQYIHFGGNSCSVCCCSSVVFAVEGEICDDCGLLIIGKSNRLTPKS